MHGKPAPSVVEPRPAGDRRAAAAQGHPLRRDRPGAVDDHVHESREDREPQSRRCVRAPRREGQAGLQRAFRRDALARPHTKQLSPFASRADQIATVPPLFGSSWLPRSLTSVTRGSGRLRTGGWSGKGWRREPSTVPSAGEHVEPYGCRGHRGVCLKDLEHEPATHELDVLVGAIAIDDAHDACPGLCCPADERQPASYVQLVPRAAPSDSGRHVREQSVFAGRVRAACTSERSTHRHHASLTVRRARDVQRGDPSARAGTADGPSAGARS